MVSTPSFPERVEAVTLDVGGVLTLPPVHRLLDGPVSPLEVLVAHHRAVAEEDALLSTAEVAADRSGPARTAYHHALARGLADDPAAVADLVAGLEELGRRQAAWDLAAPDGRETLAALHRSGVPVAVVSNSDGTVESQLVDMGICQRGEGALPSVVTVIDSALVGVRKPDPAIFAPALAALGTDPARTVHVGDTVAFDVGAAHAAGLASLHYDASSSCRVGHHRHLRALTDLPALVGRRR